MFLCNPIIDPNLEQQGERKGLPGASNAMDHLGTEIEVSGEDLPRSIPLLKLLGLALIDQNNYEDFLRGPSQGLFPVVHDAAFWKSKLQEGNLLAGMTIIQIQSQTEILAHMIVHLASQNQTTLQWEPDPDFTPLQNSYLILTVLGVDMLPVGALRPFEPWDVVEMGLIGSLYNMPDRTLSHAEQSSLVTKLERQHRRLLRVLPIACVEVDLCVAGGLFPIFCKMSDEQQEQVVMNNGFLREKFPVLRKLRHRTPFFLVTLYLEVVDNTSKPISGLFLWGLEPVGVLVKNMLIELFQEPDIAPEEICMVLAALLALSDTYFLGMYQTSRRAECPMGSLYQRPSISKFFEWVQEPSRLHLGWDVIETLICSFQAVFAPETDEIAIPAINILLNSLKPATEDLQVPKPYYQYWRQRQRHRSHLDARNTFDLEDAEDATVDVEDAIGTVNPMTVSTKDLMDAIKHSWYARARGESRSPIVSHFDEQSIQSTQSVQEEPPPAYLPSNLSDLHDKHGEQTLYKADIESKILQSPMEDTAQTLGRSICQCESVRQNQSSTRKSWVGRFRRMLRQGSGS